jgi:hypothetical protein
MFFSWEILDHAPTGRFSQACSLVRGAAGRISAASIPRRGRSPSAPDQLQIGMLPATFTRLGYPDAGISQQPAAAPSRPQALPRPDKGPLGARGDLSFSHGPATGSRGGSRKSAGMSPWPLRSSATSPNGAHRIAEKAPWAGPGWAAFTCGALLVAPGEHPMTRRRRIGRLHRAGRASERTNEKGASSAEHRLPLGHDLGRARISRRIYETNVRVG